MSDFRPTVWQMVKEAIDALGSPTTNVAIRNWILRKYPGTNPATINCQIIFCTVNQPSRIHYSDNAKPRICHSRHDFLYRPARGQVELYKPEKHGQWAIVESSNGSLIVKEVEGRDTEGRQVLTEVSARETQEVEPSELGRLEECGHAFAAEAHLRDYLAQHLDLVEPGLQLFVDEEDRVGVEYRTPIGLIDLLTIDSENGLVVIELKVSKGPDAVAGQVLRYKNWVKAHLAQHRRVRGVIIAQHINDKIRYAISGDPEISLMEYEISLKLHPVDCSKMNSQ